jgi:hypothetical protein
MTVGNGVVGLWPVGSLMEILVTVAAGESADKLRELRSWLVEEPELRGRVSLVEAEPATGGSDSRRTHRDHQ